MYELNVEKTKPHFACHSKYAGNSKNILFSYMEYNNPHIPIAAIPQFQEIPLQRVEPDYKKVLYFNWSIVFAIVVGILVAVFILNKELHVWWPITLAVLVVLLGMVLTVASIEIGFKKKSWAVRDKDILFKNGWLFQSTHIIPFTKVQHCILKTGPISRRYKLASLRFMTAASHERDISINGLSQTDAEKIKGWIMEKNIEHGREAI